MWDCVGCYRVVWSSVCVQTIVEYQANFVEWMWFVSEARVCNGILFYTKLDR